MRFTPDYTPSASPAELALPLAEELIVGNHMDSFVDVGEKEKDELEVLEARAHIFGMLGKRYFVSSGRSVTVPARFEVSDHTEYNNYEGLDFSGLLITYSTVRIGRNLAGNTMRALCLTFDEVTLLPYFDRLPAEQLLHTPAFAVQTIDQVA